MIALISSIFSGIAGGGGAFVMGPYWLISGMSPAQGATTGSFMAIGMSVSSVAAFRKTDHLPTNKKLLLTLLATAFFAAIIGAIILPKIDVQAFKYLLAVITISALPLIFMKSRGNHRFTRHGKLGLSLAIALLIASSIITSSVFSILFALTLMNFYNMSVFQMTALRRLIGIAQSMVLFVALAAQGYFIWQHAVAGIIGGALGSYIGTRYAIKKGETFAKYALASMSFAGAVALIL